MKTIGLIGGLSWESTAEYYRVINEAVKQRLGGFHSAKIVLHSVDFAEIEVLQREGRWNDAADALAAAGRSIEDGGADFGLICANTMHKVYDEVRERLSIPLIHIVDATAREIRAAGFRSVGLLGTRYTMEDDFYKDRLARKHGIEALVPGEEERIILHRILYDELCLGDIRPESRQAIRKMMAGLGERGAGGIILGCTELPLIVGPADSDLPLFDTTSIHALAAVDEALKD
jgi:aspartate racemase